MAINKIQEGIYVYVKLLTIGYRLIFVDWICHYVLIHFYFFRQLGKANLPCAIAESLRRYRDILILGRKSRNRLWAITLVFFLFRDDTSRCTANNVGIHVVHSG